MAAALTPCAVLGRGLFRELLGGFMVIMAFVLLLVFGALIGNSPRLATRGA